MIGSSIAVNNRRSHGLMSRAAGVTPVPGDSCVKGATRFYGFDDTESHRIGHRSTNGADNSRILAGSFPTMLHRAGLGPYLGAGRGAVLAPGKRTVTQALRVMTLANKPGFGRYHEVLNRARWDARDVARRALLHLLAVLSPSGEVVIGIDDTIERRWGGKIKARGIYRDAVRSSHGHFVKTSGLRWLSLAVMLPLPFAGQRWALPFLTVLAPSARWSEAQGRRHKALTDWARQAVLQTKRWLPDRRVVVVADSGFSALELIAAVRRYVCLITRLRALRMARCNRCAHHPHVVRPRRGLLVAPAAA